jgi:hypothetical protein
MHNGNEGTEDLLELIIERLGEEPGLEFAHAKEDLEEISARFRYTNWLDAETAHEGPRGPLIEFLDRHNWLIPRIYSILADVIFAHVFERLEHLAQIKAASGIGPQQAREAQQLLGMLRTVNQLLNIEGEKGDGSELDKLGDKLSKLLAGFT